ncbi:unnamed protein product, partial [Acidocella sp. C78]
VTIRHVTLISIKGEGGSVRLPEIRAGFRLRSAFSGQIGISRGGHGRVA